MELKELILIVAEAVDKILAQRKPKELIFNKDGFPLIYRQNGAYYIDRLPVKYLPLLALGITTNVFTEFVSQLIAEGSDVFISEVEETKNKNYNILFSSYINILKTFGVKFASESKEAHIEAHKEARKEARIEARKEAQPSPDAPAAIRYLKKVLSKQDLLQYSNTEIKISKDVLVTDLAREEAARRGIKITVT
jgi:hypothetical protein